MKQIPDTSQKSVLLRWENRIVYEIFVQSFADGNGDGIGDIIGLHGKLDYLSALGINALWLMPIHPSPSYHKYDITDYFKIHPDYGSLEDFKELVDAAHQRDILILIDLVLNHTSDQHPWFLEAQRGPENKYRNYYIWHERKLEGSVTTNWHQLSSDEANRGERYYGFFWHGMPDLNMDHEDLRNEVVAIGKFWLEEMRIDGFRLDAAKYIYGEDKSEENQAFWKFFKQEMQKIKEDVFLVGEVWDNHTYVAPYLNCFHACFNFDMSYAIQEVLQKKRPSLFLNKAHEIYEAYQEFNQHYIDAIFLTNHDQNRISSHLKGGVKRAKLAASILMSLPGIPFLYYGEEIGMQGKKPDEYIREPMIWEEGDSAQTNWIEPKYSDRTKVKSVSVHLNDERSLLNHYRKLIKLRKEHSIFAKGNLQKLNKGEDILAYIRRSSSDSVLVVHNLGRKSKVVSISDSFNSILFCSGNKFVLKEGYILLPGISTVILRKSRRI